LMFIDADISFEALDIFRLLEWSSDGRKGIVAGIPVDRNKGKIFTSILDLDDQQQVQINAQGLVRAKRVPTAFMMIRRDVFATLTPHLAKDQSYRRIDVGSNVPIGDSVKHLYFETMIDPTTGTYISEDYAFCARWRAVGGEIWVDLESKFTHVGPWAFKGDFTTQLVGYSRA